MRSESHENADSTAVVEDGRYCYCVIDTAMAREEDSGHGNGSENEKDSSDGEESENGTAFDDGVDGNTVRVIDTEGIGLVVHDCDRVPEPDDPVTVQRWLLEHQSVVDEAAETFGTPLPLRFGTVIDGGDEAVEGWLRAESSRLTELLDTFAGRQEYRVHLLWDDERIADGIDDDRLRELEAERNDADEGRSFLLGKRYEQRLAQVTQDKKEHVTALLERRLAELAERLERLGPPGAAAREAIDGPVADERFSVLVPTDRVDEVSTALAEIEETPGLTIRYTGPWPPYTFTPELGGGESG